jgi:hypothetical protein
VRRPWAGVRLRVSPWQAAVTVPATGDVISMFVGAFFDGITTICNRRVSCLFLVLYDPCRVVLVHRVTKRHPQPRHTSFAKIYETASHAHTHTIPWTWRW